jgi:hypothetical protein
MRRAIDLVGFTAEAQRARRKPRAIEPVMRKAGTSETRNQDRVASAFFNLSDFLSFKLPGFLITGLAVFSAASASLR